MRATYWPKHPKESPLICRTPSRDLHGTFPSVVWPQYMTRCVHTKMKDGEGGGAPARSPQSTALFSPGGYTIAPSFSSFFTAAFAWGEP